MAMMIAKRDHGKKENKRKSTKSSSRSEPLLFGKESTLAESERSEVSYNYCSKDFPPLPSETEQEHEYYSSKSESSSMGPAVTLSPEVRPIPDDGSPSGSSLGTSVSESRSPSPPPDLQQTIFRPNGLIERLPKNALNDQFGLAAFIVGQMYRCSTAQPPLPDLISDEVIREGDWRDYSSSYFHKPTVPKVVSEDREDPSESPEPLPLFNVSLLVSQGMFGAGPGDDPIAQIQNAWVLKARMFNEDLLFYLFYTFTQDILQVVAAQHLFNKGWRYHMGEQVWIQPIKDAIYVKILESSLETGVYKLFDSQLWKVTERDLCVELNQIEKTPWSVNYGLTSIM